MVRIQRPFKKGGRLHASFQICANAKTARLVLGWTHMPSEPVQAFAESEAHVRGYNAVVVLF
eukprot:6961395-Lingulodinium_polyedra.AAC.1